MASLCIELEDTLIKTICIANLSSKTVEVVKHEDEFYCVPCYINKKEFNPLRKINSEPNTFNCPYCSKIRNYDPKIAKYIELGLKRIKQQEPVD